MSEGNVLANLIAELRRGTQIISVLSQLQKNQYGYSLLQDLQKMDMNIEAGTLYPLMRRLESQNILQSEWDTSDSRPRKYYILSPMGRDVLIELKKEWYKLASEMEQIFEEEIK